MKGVIHVKVPLCPDQKMERVEVIDASQTNVNSPTPLWWASGPKDVAVSRGDFELWSGNGFSHSATVSPSVSVPRTIEVDYALRNGDGAGGVFDVKTLKKAQLKSGQYWTYKGAKTFEQIDDQLHCGGRARGHRTQGG